MNPCKDAKCILYPICINKENIDCPSVQDYIRQLELDKSPTTRYYSLIFKHMRKIFPNIRTITLFDNYTLFITRRTNQLVLINPHHSFNAKTLGIKP